MPHSFATTFQPELIDASSFVADNATIIGEVHIGAHSSIWYQAVIRGDLEPITIGEGSNIQDLCMLHADPQFPCQIGDRVTVGHSAIVHGATIEDEVMIGMRAVVMNGAVIGKGSLVGVGAVVTEGKVIPPNSLVLGLPGRVLRSTNEEDRARICHAADHYINAAKAYASAQK